MAVDSIPAEESGFIAIIPDLLNGWSQGGTRDEALAQRPTICSTR